MVKEPIKTKEEKNNTISFGTMVNRGVPEDSVGVNIVAKKGNTEIAENSGKRIQEQVLQ